MRTMIPVNFGWKYARDFQEAYVSPSFDDTGFATVDIPHANQELPVNYFDEADYQFVSCYRKRFDAPALGGDARLLLHFEGVSCYARVYLNGSYVGEHKGGYTAFSFDITQLVEPQGNVLAVVVDSTERPEIPPFGNVVDYLCFGGIYREVWMEVVNEAHMEDVFVRTRDIPLEKKLLDIDFTFSCKTSGTLGLQVLDGDTVIAERSCTFDAKVLNVKWKVEGLLLWDTDRPQLYTLRAVLNNGQDEQTVRFGVREVRFRKDGFYLNGKKLKIRGLNRHQSYPYVGYAMPASAQRADADLLKYELGCNLVRTSHYPNSKHFLDRCDEIGLLVFTEIPSWQFTGEGEWRELFLENIRRMILHDRNHPSILLWGVRVNEGQDCDELYLKANAVAHSLDDTRQTGGVRNFPQSHLLEDVYTYNDFIHSGGKIALNSPLVVAGPNAPYLVTEHNGHMYPTKSFDREEVRVEHALRHTRVLNAAYGNDRISGAIGWCMADYNTHKDFGSGDRICYHGVTDIFRVPKLAAAVYASQQDERPVMEVSSSMDIGEHPGSKRGQVYVFTNCDYVKLYKNGVYMSTAYPNRERFPSLPHPPVFADDFIGDALKTKEGLSEEAIRFIKPVLIAGSKYGMSIPPQYFLLAGAGLLAGGLKIKNVVSLVEKYIGGWGDEQVTFTFEGYKDGELVKTVVKTASTQAKLEVRADAVQLAEGDTYDVTRVVLKAVDQNGNRLPFCSEPVTLTASGAVEIIGPRSVSLIGGDVAFWVRTCSREGVGKVTVTTPNMGEYSVEFQVHVTK